MIGTNSQALSGHIRGWRPRRANKTAELRVRVLPDIRLVSDSSPVTVVVEGELDLVTIPRLSVVLHMLLESGERSVSLDMSAVEFINATAIGLLVDMAEKATQQGGAIRLSRPSRQVVRVLEILQLDSVLAGLRCSETEYDSRGSQVEVAT